MPKPEEHLDLDSMDNVLAEAEGLEMSEPTPVPDVGLPDTDLSKISVSPDLGSTPPAEPAPAPPVEPPPAEPAPADATPPPTKFPNPLGLQLTECHLPIQFVKDRVLLLKYVGRHFNLKQQKQISPSGNELELFRTYRSMVRGQRPVLPRTFAAAVRLIASGKPLEPPREPDLDTMAL